MKLTLRDLFWLTLVVGLVFGWWLEHLRMSAALDRARTEAETNTTAAKTLYNLWKAAEAERGRLANDVRDLRRHLQQPEVHIDSIETGWVGNLDEWRRHFKLGDEP